MDKINDKFTKSQTLKAHYQTVGFELQTFDKISVSFFSAFTEFREGVAFVPVEVLKAYLDDLLDLTVNEQALYIKSGKNLLIQNLFIISGLIISFTIGLFIASSLNSIFFAGFISILIAAPFIIYWHFMPQLGSARRMRFARIVSKEIARRNGIDDDGISKRKLLLDKFLSKSHQFQGLTISSKCKNIH